MIYLRDILSFIGIQSAIEQIAYVKVMAYRDFFSKPTLEFDEKPEHASSSNKQIKCAETAKAIWQKTGLKEYYPHGIIISDDEAIQYLETPFSSLEEGFEWLYNLSEIKFLRKSFHAEGIGPDREKTSVNLLRWQNKKNIADEEKLLPYLKTLGLSNESKLPKLSGQQHIVLFSNLEHVLKERIDYLPDFTGDLYCLTGPRGLFNFEPSLSSILAKWFNKPEYEPLIQSVLDRHHHDEYQWTCNLSGLKKEILSVVSETIWPAAHESYYYRHKDIYDQAAHIAKREPLDCLGGPWPVALDLITHHLKNRDAVKIHPVIALGKNGKLTGVSDEVEAWYDKFGKKILDDGKLPIFIASNSIHAVPYIRNNLAHNLNLRESITKSKLANSILSFPSLDTRVTPIQINIAGPGNGRFRIHDAFDTLAKILFSIKSNIKLFLQEYQDEHEYHEIQSRLARKMITSHQFQNYVSLADASFRLAATFYFERQFIKTTGLINFAINIIKHSLSYDKLVDGLIKNIALTMRAFIYESCRILKIFPSEIDITYLLNQCYDNRKNLEWIRSELVNKFASLKLNNIQTHRYIYRLIYNKMTSFIIDLTHQTLSNYKIKKPDFAFILLGSYSRYQQTPYSDLESCIVTDDHGNLNQLAYEVSKLLLLRIINLGETVLPSLNIIIQRDKKPVSLVGTIFDFYTPQGLSFDRGFITPLGKKILGNVVFRLIGSPERMATQMASFEGYNKYIFLPQLLRSSRMIFGDIEKYNRFLSQLRCNDFTLSSYAEMLFYKDTLLSLPLLKFNNKTLSIKQGYYRPVVCFIEDLSLSLKHHADDAFEKIDQLYEQGILNDTERCLLENCLLLTQCIRLYQHFKFKEQKTEITTTDPYYEHVKYLQETMKFLYHSMTDRISHKENLRLKREKYLLEYSIFSARQTQSRRNPTTTFPSEYVENTLALSHFHNNIWNFY